AIAREHQVGLILDAVTWRASQDWGAQLGYSADEMDDVNRDAVSLMEEIRAEHTDEGIAIVTNGCVGPRGDAYTADASTSPVEAEHYHHRQITVLSQTAADMISGLTLTNTAEATGIVRAARAVDMPVVVSFTVETDGRLPSGQSLRGAIEQVDAETDRGAAYFMINCAYPSHFADALEEGAPWTKRIRGIRANASNKSHAELDESSELDDGNPATFATDLLAVHEYLPNANVLGGCCGTDDRHIAAITEAWTSV
ncbi:MAG: homocysteine S-methyltransferase family protein, partial [Gaiellaceae bacterium]